MVTTKSLRYFAADCLADAKKAGNPSQREVILNVARTWAKTAEMIDRRVREGRGEALPDLRHKLN
jgi:hypothetical protein